MNKITINTAIFATIFGLGLCVAYLASFYVVQAKVTELASLRETAAEQTLKESAYNTLLELLENTTEDREELASRFLSERDTVSFINQSEQAAAQRGLQLETKNLSLTEGEDGEFDTLLVEFSIVGPETMVRQYVQLLESLPYHNQITELSLYNETGTSNWRGETKLLFTLIP